MSLSENTKRLLKTRFLGRNMVEFKETDSTNSRALDLAAAGCPSGTVILAEHQTGGRGRFARKWIDEPEKNLILSVVLKPDMDRGIFGLIGLMASLAVGDAIAAITPHVRTAIKWPNDVYTGSRKLAGILVESKVAANGPDTIVLGIGLNVNQRHFPSSLSGSATSLRIETGDEIDRPSLLACLLLELETGLLQLEEDAGLQVRRTYEQRVKGIGEQVTVIPSTNTPPITGIFTGIDDSGAIRLRLRGEEKTFHAGELTLRTE